MITFPGQMIPFAVSPTEVFYVPRSALGYLRMEIVAMPGGPEPAAEPLRNVAVCFKDSTYAEPVRKFQIADLVVHPAAGMDIHQIVWVQGMVTGAPEFGMAVWAVPIENIDAITEGPNSVEINLRGLYRPELRTLRMQNYVGGWKE